LFNTLLRLSTHVVATAPAESAASSPGLQGSRDGLRVLIAEDNPVNVRLLTLLLEDLGYTADVVGNGVESIAALRRRTYDVVLMDVQMPVMDGLEATRQIHREWEPSRRPRVIALTAGVMSEEVQTCRSAGMDDFLAKPLEVGRLAAALMRCKRLGTMEAP
jgi:CheY-like chemotaxis protein